MVSHGSVNDVVDTYLIAGTEMSTTGIIPDNAPRISTGEARIRRVELLNLAGMPISEIYLGQSFRVTLTIEVMKTVRDVTAEISISSLDGTCVTTSFNVDGEQPPIMLLEGWYKVSVDLKLTLLPQHYTFDVAVHYYPNGPTIDFVQRALNFTVLNVAKVGTDKYWPDIKRGFVRPTGHWHLPEAIPEAAACSLEVDSADERRPLPQRDVCN